MPAFLEGFAELGRLTSAAGFAQSFPQAVNLDNLMP